MMVFVIKHSLFEQWRVIQEARSRSAKPLTSVRIRHAPPFYPTI